jgi:hypothetical protein
MLLPNQDAETLDAFISVIKVATSLSDNSVASDEFLSALISDFSRAISEGSSLASSFLDQMIAVAGMSDELESSDAFGSMVFMLSSLTEASSATSNMSQILRIPVDGMLDAVSALDDFESGYRVNQDYLDMTLAFDAWQSRLIGRAILLEAALAGHTLSIPLPFDVGFVHAVIRISAALSGTITNRAALSGTIDINRHYNE